LYGSTKVGVVRKDVSTVATPPAGQPDGQAEDRIFEHDPQPPAAYIVRSETLTGFATRAQLNVTRTIGPRSHHNCVMLQHLSFSFRDLRVDAHYQTSYCLGGARTRCQTDLAPLSMRGPAETKKWGRGSRDNLSGRGRWRGAGGVILDKQSEIPPTYSGQIICGAARAFRGTIAQVTQSSRKNVRLPHFFPSRGPAERRRRKKTVDHYLTL